MIAMVRISLIKLFKYISNILNISNPSIQHIVYRKILNRVILISSDKNLFFLSLHRCLFSRPDRTCVRFTVKTKPVSSEHRKYCEYKIFFYLVANFEVSFFSFDTSPTKLTNIFSSLFCSKPIVTWFASNF